jgi:hypothetical protein
MSENRNLDPDREWPTMLALSPTRQQVLDLGGPEVLALLEHRDCVRCGRALLVLGSLAAEVCAMVGRVYNAESGAACPACVAAACSPGVGPRLDTAAEVLAVLDNDPAVAAAFVKHQRRGLESNSSPGEELPAAGNSSRAAQADATPTSATSAPPPGRGRNPRPRRLTPAERSEIAARVARGDSTDVIAREFGVSRRSAKRLATLHQAAGQTAAACRQQIVTLSLLIKRLGVALDRARQRRRRGPGRQR